MVFQSSIVLLFSMLEPPIPHFIYPAILLLSLFFCSKHKLFKCGR
ncbi:hypothetical protein NC651_016759 [Populus alba x Populus x berolinensis]|nr:hypothetical protein NC651_016759 [Populus alba x Populus x berolinensis]